VSGDIEHPHKLSEYQKFEPATVKQVKSHPFTKKLGWCLFKCAQAKAFVLLFLTPET
jgi:hypothetical protein